MEGVCLVVTRRAADGQTLEKFRGPQAIDDSPSGRCPDTRSERPPMAEPKRPHLSHTPCREPAVRRPRQTKTPKCYRCRHGGFIRMTRPSRAEQRQQSSPHEKRVVPGPSAEDTTKPLHRIAERAAATGSDHALVGPGRVVFVDIFFTRASLFPPCAFIWNGECRSSRYENNQCVIS